MIHLEDLVKKSKFARLEFGPVQAGLFCHRNFWLFYETVNFGITIFNNKTSVCKEKLQGKNDQKLILGK